MIVEQELRQWAEDRERLRATQCRIDSFARDWSAGAIHRNLDDALATLEAPSAATVARKVSALFADDEWVAALIRALAAEMAADPFFDPPFRALSSDIHSGLIIYENDHVSIAAGVSRAGQLAAKKGGPRGPASIGFTGQVGVLKFVKAGGARLAFWEAPLITAEFSAARAGSCRRTGDRALTDGEVLIVDGRFEGYVIEHARSNLVVLQAVIKRDSAPLSVEYDSQGHHYVGCSATDDGASRIQMMTTLLRKLGEDGAFETVAAFLDHPAFFVRWHVMRELLGIDARAALPRLRRMAASDPHSENRRAAALVLERFAPEGEEAVPCPA